MFRAIIIFVLVIAAVFGGLLILRTSGRAGMPDDAVLKRASKRARDQAAADDKEDGQAPK